MALIKFGAFVTDVRGKIGGTVFSRGKSGAYAKNRVIPSNPRTSAQQSVRGFFGTLSSLWRTLTQDERDNWNELANELSFQNKIGDAIKISGLALYQKFNGNLNTIGVATLAAPVAPQGVTAIGAVSVAPAVDEIIVGASLVSEEVVGTELAIFATPSISPGINNYNNRFRLIGTTTATLIGGGINVYDDYIAKFGAPVLGSRVAVRLLPINSNTGESGVAVQGDAIVV